MKKNMMTILAAIMVILTACGSEVENKPQKEYDPNANYLLGEGHCKQGYVYRINKCVPECDPYGTKEELEDGTCICYRPFTGNTCSQCKQEEDRVTTEDHHTKWKLFNWGTEYKSTNDEVVQTIRCTNRAMRVFGLEEDEITFSYNAKYNKDFDLVSIQPLTFLKTGIDYQRTEDNLHIIYNWFDAQKVCPEDWRLPTLEEALSVAEDHILSLEDYWTSSIDESTEDSYHVYSIYYDKETKEISVHSDTKDKYKAVICVTER